MHLFARLPGELAGRGLLNLPKTAEIIITLTSEDPENPPTGTDLWNKLRKLFPGRGDNVDIQELADRIVAEAHEPAAAPE
jgi:hypothetical protein